MYITGWPLVFVIVSAIGFWAIIIWRLASPFHCQCGHTSFFARGMMRHIALRHGYHEPK